MADNVAITAGSGTNIATDEVTGTGEHVQVVKLAIAADGSRTAVPADGTDGLLVNLGTNNDVTVTGSVTANAGTNLNTSALAIETGGNLAASATSLAVIDDWDESDRAKVNVIAGQAGITAGAGAVAANTPRVTHASDDPVTTSVQLLDDAIVADDAQFTPATTKVMMAGFTLDNTSTDVVDEGDAGAARITSDRRQIVQLGESGAKYVKGGGSKTDTTAQSLMAASGDAALSNYLAWVTIYNSSATNTAVEIRDGTTTVVAVIPAPAYGGATFVPTYPIKMTANTATNAYAQTGVTTLYMYGGGYTCV